jgi:hypothetical protein
MFQAFCVILSTLVNYSFFWLNDGLFNNLEFTQGVNWVFLPSGVHLLLVMVLGPWASLGLAISAAIIKHQLFPEIDFLDVGINGLIAGIGPLFALWLGENLLKLDPSLKANAPTHLLKFSALFSVVSATLHQLWFAVDGQSQSLLRDAPVMALGDFLGALILLYSFKLALLVSDNIRDKYP